MSDYALSLDLIRQTNPMVHCITHPIASNNSANMLLAIGARPMMAQHPLEVADITKSANALSVSLGNITPDRLEAIGNSGKASKEWGIPCILDLVGVACSNLRLNFAKEFIAANTPCVIKGNATEIKALALETCVGVGVDVLEEDRVVIKSGNESGRDIVEYAKKLGKKYNCVVVISGATDIVTDGEKCVAVNNGCAQLGQITGTGCILNTIIAAALSVSNPFVAAVDSVALFGVAAQLAKERLEKQNVYGSGSFYVALLDVMCVLDSKTVMDYMDIKENI